MSARGIAGNSGDIIRNPGVNIGIFSRLPVKPMNKKGYGGSRA